MYFKKEKMKYVYTYEGGYYINLTNRCSNNCDFCIRHGRVDIEGHSMWLKKEPTAEEIIEELKTINTDKVVFCGFGEPLYALDVMLEVARFAKENGISTRVNTNGQAELIAGEGVAEKMKGLLDVVNISINASNNQEYMRVCHPIFKEKAYEAVMKFIADCKKVGLNVVLSVVEGITDEELKKTEKVASDSGVAFRYRDLYESHSEDNNK